MNIIRLDLTEEVMRIKQIMRIDENVQHIYQPTGNSCGPTCIKMVGDFILGDVGKIDDICKTCGTDWIVGTPPDKMKKGLDSLGIKYIEHVNEKEPYQGIRNVIDKGNVAIVRTITQGIPHWIVISSYNDETFSVNDPWLGPLMYNEKQLGKIWKVRDFFYFEIMTGQQVHLDKVSIRRMTEEDTKVIYNKLADVFDKTGLSNEEIWEEMEGFELNNSIVAEVDGQLAGFYFMANHPIPEGGQDYDKLKDLNGIEGIALGVFKEFKNKGVGKKLIEYTQHLQGYDYLWGYQFKSLKNIDDWMKRRKLYFENDEFYITYQMLK